MSTGLAAGGGAGPGTGAPTWRALVADAVAAGLDPAEARRIGEEASGRAGAEWALALDEASTALTHHRFRALVERRAAGEPLQYVLGRWGFRGLDLLVDRRVLIPRPETEWVVEVALGLLAPADAGAPAVVVDLGTGSGAIALSVAQERWPGVRVVGTDVSADALAVARANLAGVGRAAALVTLHEGDWWDAVPAELRGAVDLAISNPPYVAPDDDLPAEVADWEPRTALVPGPRGLEAVEAILAGAPAWLRPGGWLVCEIGETQGREAAEAARSAGLAEVEVRPDLTGRDRILLGRRP